MKPGKTYCIHDTEFVREEPSLTGRPLKWYRCKKCGREFTEKFPTSMMCPPEPESIT